MIMTNILISRRIKKSDDYLVFKVKNDYFEACVSTSYLGDIQININRRIDIRDT